MTLPAEIPETLASLAAAAQGDVSRVRLLAIASSLETVAAQIRETLTTEPKEPKP